MMEICNCNWFDDEFADDSQVHIACGCNNPGCVARFYRDIIFHWRGEHFRVGCLLEAVHVEMGRLVSAILEHADRLQGGSLLPSSPTKKLSDEHLKLGMELEQLVEGLLEE